jgi:hypothetical protein
MGYSILINRSYQLIWIEQKNAKIIRIDSSTVQSYYYTNWFIEYNNQCEDEDENVTKLRLYLSVQLSSLRNISMNVFYIWYQTKE